MVGVDLAEDMLAEARKLTPPELADRVRFERADAERLSYPDGSFDLVSLANMIPFFEELARVTAPGGAVVFSFSAGPETPIYVPPEVLRARLSEHGFAEFADFAAGNGTALSARKGASGVGFTSLGRRRHGDTGPDVLFCALSARKMTRAAANRIAADTDVATLWARRGSSVGRAHG